MRASSCPDLPVPQIDMISLQPLQAFVNGRTYEVGIIIEFAFAFWQNLDSKFCREEYLVACERLTIKNGMGYCFDKPHLVFLTSGTISRVSPHYRRMHLMYQ